MKWFAAVFVLLSLATPAFAVDRYVRAGATGANNGTDWNNAYTDLPICETAMVRATQDTCWVADGTYSSTTFNVATSGTNLLTVKKATIASHGTSTGWIDAYGDGQAVLGSQLTFSAAYFTIDGNGTWTGMAPEDTNSYGFRVNGATATANQITMTSGAQYITLRYTHVYNTLSSINSCSSLVYAPGGGNHHKFQYSFFENSGQDGFVFDGVNFVLFEYSRVKEAGRLLEGPEACHGQTFRAWTGAADYVVRYNVWDTNEGQSLINTSNAVVNFRFYGNLVMNKTGVIPTYGFNTSGGLYHDNSELAEPGIVGLHWYNNTTVNVGGDYQGVSSYVIGNAGSDNQIYNDLHYNAESNGVVGPSWTYGYNACGGGGTGVCTGGVGNHQTNLTSAIFLDYANNDFRLASATDPGLALTAQSWWSGGADTFFGTLDSALDMFGITRGADGNWDRGAFEIAPPPPPTFPQVAASNTSTTDPASTNHVVSLPTGIASGHLLICAITINLNPAALTWPAGWTVLHSTLNGTNIRMETAYRVADGTEGATITVTSSLTEGSSHLCYRITGHASAQAPQVGVASAATSQTPDPPSLTPSGGTKSYLWITVSGNDSGIPITAYPANYTANQLNSIGPLVGIGSATRELEANLEDPGTLTLAIVEQWIAQTVAVYPVASVGVATKLVITTEPSGCTGSVACSTVPTVTCQDANGNTVTTCTNSVTLSILSGPSGGVISGTTNPQALVNGVRAFTGFTLNKVGTYIIRAESIGSGLAPDDSADILVTISAPTNLQFITQPVNGEAGTALTQQPSVGSYDAGGNLTTATDSVTLTLNTCTALAATTNPLSETNGVAQFAGVRVTTGGTGCTLTAAAAGRTSATSVAFDISAVPEVSSKGAPVGPGGSGR